MTTTGSEQARYAYELDREIQRYLAAVDVFRAEGCEPSWQVERDAAPLGSSTRLRPLLATY